MTLYDAKPYVVTIDKGMKLKYRMNSDIGVILFDEAYFLPDDKQE